MNEDTRSGSERWSDTSARRAMRRAVGGPSPGGGGPGGPGLAPALLLALLLALLPSPAALAQGPPPPPPPGVPEEGSAEWQDLMDKIAMLRNFRLIEALDLDEESGTKLAVYMKGKERERVEILMARREVGQEIQRFLAEGTDDDARARELLQRAVELDQREGDFDRELLAGLDRILTPSQQLRFVLVSREFDREVQEMIREQRRDARRRHGAGSAGGPPPPRPLPAGGE